MTAEIKSFWDKMVTAITTDSDRHIIAGKGVESDNLNATNFTMQLSVLVTTGLNGSSVECHEDLPASVTRLIGQQVIINNNNNNNLY